MDRLRHVGRAAAALALVVLAVGCRDGDQPSCEGGCGSGTLCLYAVDMCVPQPGEGGTCPDGYVYRECATGSCPTCRDCVPACLPERIPAARSEHATEGALASAAADRGARCPLPEEPAPEPRRAGWN